MVALAGPAAAATTSVQLHASGENGHSVFPSGPPSGQPCEAADSIGFLTDYELAPGQFSSLPGTFDLSLDILPADDAASLLPDGSEVTLTNERGTVGLRLSAGSCEQPTLTFDGQTVAGSGTWSVDPGETTGAYRQATGSGTFNLTARLAPSIVWSFDLNGTLAVLSPSLAATVARSGWAHRDVDYHGRVATVTYRVLNTGPGDAFDVRILSVGATEGIEAIDFQPLMLGDLPAGEFVEVRVRWGIGQASDRGPAAHREFDTELDLQRADALDVADSEERTVHVVVPAAGE